VKENTVNLIKSLKFRFAVVTTMVIIFMLGGIGALQYAQKRSELYAGVASSVKQATSRLASSLISSLWDMNTSNAVTILGSEFDNSAIMGISVHDAQNGLFAASRRSPSGFQVGSEPVFDGNNLSSTANVLKDGNSIGTVTVFYNYRMVKTDLFRLLGSILIQTIATAVILSLVMMFLVGRFVIRPLRALGNEIDGIAKGEADLTKVIDIHREDEIGNLVIGFNQFVSKLADIVSRLKETQCQMGEVSERLAATSQESAGSVSQIVANIGSIKKMTGRQLESVEESHGAVKSVSARVSTLDLLIETQASCVTEASSSIEEMLGNIAAVTSSIEKMAARFDSLANATEIGVAKQVDVSLRVEAIANQSALLGEANKTIASIASMTNLLAMNAAIEAAHAGNAGKGFSVVADEIRKLAATSAEQSHNIGAELNTISSSIELVVSASQDSKKAFDTVAGDINKTESLVREIEHAMIEQRAGSSHILEALKNMLEAQSSVKNGANEMTVSNATVLNQMEILKDASAQIAGSMDEIAKGAEDMNRTALLTSDLAERTRNGIRLMETAIGAFKVL
jgi:methyl-accepting chemotaxis protein